MLAASSPSDAARIDSGADALRGYGFDVVFAANIATRSRGYLAGDDALRVGELNRFFADPSIDAFFFARGGYGAMRLLEAVEWDHLARMPRPVIGYSDVTALHQALAVRTGVGSFHGPMLNTDFFEGMSPERLQWFLSALAGDAPLAWSLARSQVLCEGRARGNLFGGCLSLTAALCGTPFDFWIDDGIWFWEDVGEPTYRIDRMLTQLRLSGRLDSIRGIIIGKLKDCGAPDPMALDSLLTEFFAPLGIPVIRDFPFGHHGDNLLMPIGAVAELDTGDGILRFPEPLVKV